MQLTRYVLLIASITCCLLTSAHAFVTSNLPLSGQSYVSKPLVIGRIAIITTLPRLTLRENMTQAQIEKFNQIYQVNFRERYADPMNLHFTKTFQNKGIAVSTEIQQTAQLAPDTDIDFTEAKKFQPDAYLLIKRHLRKEGTGSDILIELIDAKYLGIWRGSVSLRYTSNADELSQKLAQELLQILMDNRVIEFASKGNGK